MNIHKIGLIERIFKPNDQVQVKAASVSQKVDEVNLSSLAIQKFMEGTDERIKEIVRNAPDVRLDKIKVLKYKIEQENYFNNIDKEELAGRILQSPFGFRIKPL